MRLYVEGYDIETCATLGIIRGRGPRSGRGRAERDGFNGITGDERSIEVQNYLL